MKKTLLLLLLSLCVLMFSGCKDKEKEQISKSTGDPPETEEITVGSSREDTDETGSTSQPSDETNESESVPTDEPDDGPIEETRKEMTETVKETPVKTPAELGLTGYYKVEVMKTPTDLRNTAVKGMLKMANIEWLCTIEHRKQDQFATWGIDYTLKQGHVYHGLPYSNADTNYDEFIRMTADGTFGYDGPESWNGGYGIPGNQCISSVNQAVKNACDVNIGSSTLLVPGHKEFQSDIVRPVGDYEYGTVGNTAGIVALNTPEKMYECYAQLQTGDILCTFGPWTHARLVHDVKVVKDAYGKVDPKKSYAVTIEQTNTLESKKNKTFISEHGYDTTWWVDHHYTFEELRDGVYIPVTLVAYDKESPTPYIALDSEIKPETLAAGKISGTVSSSFRIHHVLYQLVDSNGKVVCDYTLHPLEKKWKTYDVSNSANSENLFKNAVHGTTYTFRMYVGIGPGERLMSKVEFKYN